MSDLEKSCIESWKLNLPLYEMKLWNEENFDVNFCAFSKKAYDEQEFAFVSDVARIYALNKDGGIYLDTDMLLLRGLPEKILQLDFFLGNENKTLLSAGILGSSKNGEISNVLLKYYQNSIFLKEERPLIPKIITNELRLFQEGVDYVSFPPDFFYPLPYQFRNFHYRKFLTKNSVGVHLWNLSWKENPHISPLAIFLRQFKYLISYFYIPASFKKFRDSSFY